MLFLKNFHLIIDLLSQSLKVRNARLQLLKLKLFFMVLVPAGWLVRRLTSAGELRLRLPHGGTRAFLNVWMMFLLRQKVP